MPSRSPMSASFSRTSLSVVSPKLRTSSNWLSVRLTRSRTVVMFSDSRQLVARTERSSSARLMFSLASVAGSMSQAAQRPGLGVHHRPQLLVLDEGVEVLAEDLGRLDQGHLRA